MIDGDVGWDGVSTGRVAIPRPSVPPTVSTCLQPKDASVRAVSKTRAAATQIRHVLFMPTNPTARWALAARDGPLCCMSLAPLDPTAHRSFAPSLRDGRRTAGLLRATAGYCTRNCEFPVRAGSRLASTRETFQARLQAPAPLSPEVKSSRRTRRRHIRTRSRTAIWSCFRSAIIPPHPEVGTQALPNTEDMFDSHLHRTCTSGELRQAAHRPKYAHEECRPEVSAVSSICLPCSYD